MQLIYESFEQYGCVCVSSVCVDSYVYVCVYLCKFTHVIVLLVRVYVHQLLCNEVYLVYYK